MKQRAVLFANGKMPAAAKILPFLEADDFLIAVDGGLRYLRNLYKTPDLLIGDLDSVTPAEVDGAKAQGCDILKFNIDKDETDLELALLAAADKGVSEILIVAALGGRLDQTLANLFLLTLPQLSGIHVRIENGDQEIFLIREKAVIHGRAGDIVSLIPLNGIAEGVLTHQLKYPLNHETLYPEQSRGISNVMLGDLAEVSLTAGRLLCLHTRMQNLEEK